MRRAIARAERKRIGHNHGQGPCDQVREAMTMGTVADITLAKRLTEAMLVGAGFSAFVFHTSFCIRFVRGERATFSGAPLPQEVELNLLSEWWFDDHTNWQAKVASLAPAGAVEPAEPVQAFELAALRWTEGTTVKGVELTSEHLRISFANARMITVNGLSEDDGLAWMLSAAGTPEAESVWSVSSHAGQLFVRCPG